MPLYSGLTDEQKALLAVLIADLDMLETKLSEAALRAPVLALEILRDTLRAMVDIQEQ